MADLSKLVNELSNLTVIEAADLATMLEEKWGAVGTGRPGAVPMARKSTEGADIKLIQELIFQPCNVVLQPFSKEEMTKGKTPDFKLMKGAELCGYCELKSPRDDWVFEFPDDIKPGESATEMRPSPTSNNLARQIESAVEQFDAVNPDHKLPNVLVLVNHTVGRTRSELHVTGTGIRVPDGGRLFTLKPDKQKRVWEAAQRVDLFLWVDAQKRTCQHVYPDDAVHRAAACRLLGIEIGEQDGAPDSLSP
jgi:Ribosomal protein L7/L12 dimerisation domain